MIKIGTRQSRLALLQTEIVKNKILEKFPDEQVEIVKIITKGDKELEKSLGSFGGKGVFTQEIEECLLNHTIDIAVHSAKDIPMEFAEGLSLGAVVEREDPRDVLITLSGTEAKNLAPGSIIGTSSLRRELQIKRMNPAVIIRNLRGNVPTRLQKLRDGMYDGIILAAAGLARLKLLNEPDLSYEFFESEEFAPAAGQGIIALEIRENSLAEVMQAINDKAAADSLMAERTFLIAIGGSCNAPCGVICRKEEKGYVLHGMYAADGVNASYASVELPELTEESRTDKLKEAAQALAYSLTGHVSIVGAGPGRKELISEAALSCVRNADVLVYDDLISPSILNEAGLDAELIYVGKRVNAHSAEQDSINEMLVRKAREGKYVIRLKGGDPFIFGRGGEEAEFLKERGISFDVVPGISSAYSVPEWAGIPVTHRDYASSVHIITGHEGKRSGKEGIDYQVLAKEEGTLLFLMGLGRLGQIADQLIAGGKASDTPVCVIQNGFSAREKIVSGTLADINEKVRKAGLSTPVIIAVGNVVSLQEHLTWKKKMPLSDQKVLLTGTRSMVKRQEKSLVRYGAEPVSISLVETRRIQERKAAEWQKQLPDYSWIVFASASGVNAFFDTLREEETDYRKLSHVKFAAVGKATADLLRHYGYICDFLPSEYRSEVLAREWSEMLSGRDKVLLVRGREGTGCIEDTLTEKGISFSAACLYETIRDIRRKEELCRIYNDIDYITVASGSAGRALAELLPQALLSAAAAPKIIAIGPETAKVCEAAGLSVYATAGEYTAEGITQAILEDVQALHRER